MSTDVAENATPLSAHIAEEIRALMGRRQINKVQLAKRLGVDETWVGRRLNGRQGFGVDDLPKIAAILGVSVADLLPREQGRTTGQYFPGERVIATVGGSDRRATGIRRPVRRRLPLAAGDVRPLTPLPV